AAGSAAWSLFADKSVAGAALSPVTDFKTVTARYLRLTVTQSDALGYQSNPGDPEGNTTLSVFEFHAYPPGDDLDRILQGEQCGAKSNDLGTENSADDDGGLNIMTSHDGSFLVLKQVNLGVGAAAIEARVASGLDGGTLEVRLDGANGPLVGTVVVPN